MRKITNSDINKNINTIITIGDVVLVIFIAIAVVYFFIGVSSEESAAILTYAFLSPAIYVAIGLVIRTLLKWAAYLLKTTLDIKNNISKNKKD